MRCSIIYNTYFLPEFLNQLKKYAHLKNLVQKKINLLALNPYSNCKSELLLGELKGLRSARLTKSFRIIFVICEECKNRNFARYINCPQKYCNSFSLKTIIFLTFGPHEKIY